MSKKKMCGCGCGLTWEEAVREAMNTPARLNREQAEAQVPEMWVVDISVAPTSGPKTERTK